jgi:hypothetical protein
LKAKKHAARKEAQRLQKDGEVEEEHYEGGGGV